jgi:hypothetical protein
MKYLKFIAAASIIFLLGACIDAASPKSANEDGAGSNSALTDTANYTTIQWIDSVKEMGSIKEGQQLEVNFRFMNTGSKPLVIQSATPSCGCTVPEKPEKPIMPGQEGLIKAVFNSQGRMGENHKTITITANTKGTQSHIIQFNVTVLGDKDGPKATTNPGAAKSF